MDEKAKKEMFKGLTDSQREAVETIDEDLEIVACAGAGKTRTITLRIINLIANGVDPGNIVAITFTRKAAAEMRERIYRAGEKYLGNTVGFAGMYIGTIDAFCLKMLQEYVPEYAKFSVLDEVQTKIFMERFHTTANDPTGFGGSVVDRAGNLEKRYSKKLDIYTGLMSMLNNCYYDRSIRNKWSQDLRTRLDRFNQCMKANKYFDYSSLIREMIEYLDPDSEMNGGKLPDMAKKIYEKVRYLTIDEYQDSNPPQEYLAGLFHKYGKTNLCVVGDADQTIYQFRGSDESNILGFKDKYNAKKINLSLDFRSTEAVVDIARTSILNNHMDDPDYVRMERGRVKGSLLDYEDDDTVYASFENFDEESDFIVKRIRELHENDIPYSEMAVLFRQRRRMHMGHVIIDFQSVLAEKLKRAGIDYIVEGINNLSNTPEYKASKQLFCYIDEVYFGGGSDNSGSVILNELNSRDVPAEEELKQSWNNIGIEHGEPGLTAGIEEAISELKKKKLASVKFGHDFNMQQIFQDFIGHMAFVGSDNKEAVTVLYNLGKFSKVIADYELLFFKESARYKSSRFISHLKNIADGLYPEGEEDNAYIRADAVRLMTIHQSKGLEFTAVFIPALTQGVFPGSSFDRKRNIYGAIDALDEAAMMSGLNNGEGWVHNRSGYLHDTEAERKIFYVAVTRAKKYLFLTYADCYGCYYDFYQQTEAALEEYESQFLKEAAESAYLKEYREKHAYTADHLPDMKRDPIPMVLNFSLLSNYFDCPYRFRISNFYGFVQPYSSVQGYGKMLHEIMMHIHKSWIDGKTLSESDVDRIAQNALYLPFASKPQLDKSLAGAKSCAHAYIKQNEADADKMIASEMDINIEMGDGVSVNGRIDLVRKIDDNGTDKVAIIDLKSAGKDAEQCLNAEQLKIYALGYQEMTGEKADYLMIYNLDAPDGSKNAGEDIKDTLVIEVQKKIKKAAKCIRENDLPRPKKLGDKCKNCYVRGLCSVCKKA